MKDHIVVIILGIYIFAMGLLGMARAGSFTPLYISGSIAAVTIWIGWLLSKGMRPIRSLALTWLTINVVALIYMIVDQVPARGNPDTGSVMIFGSTALLALIALVIVWRAGPRRSPRRY